MNDECKNCAVRGNMGQCAAITCSRHESWYAQELRARVTRLEEALRRGIELHENCDADTCMCGEPMHHPLSDHKPVAMLQYYGDQWVEEAMDALENQYAE